MASIKCAHCKGTHSSVNEVRACAEHPIDTKAKAIVDKVCVVPDGHYAVDDKGTLKFFRVVRPTEGKWAGRVFVDQQVSDEYHPTFAYAQRNYILGLIASQGVRECSVRYGHELGRCGVCNRTLTNEASRQAGIGPICAGRLA